MIKHSNRGVKALAMTGLIGASTLFGCASASKTQPQPQGVQDQSAGTITAEQARGVALARVQDGQASKATWAELVNAAAESDFVLIGENHGHALGLASAAALWEDILSARGEGTANDSTAKPQPRPTLAMEFFERDQQKAIDDYFAGLIDEATFRKESNRGPVESGNYPRGHRDMVEAAKKHGARLIAANAPRRYVRLARTDGYERLRGLSEEQRRLFRLPDVMPMNAYWDRFAAVMGGLGDAKEGATPAEVEALSKKRSSLEATFRSQVMWDWTMAQSVADARTTPGGISRPVVLVVGRFHTDETGGTVQALRRLAPMTNTGQAKILVVSFVDSEAPKDAPAAKADLSRADFVVYVGAGGSGE